ncbi:hypothetical protein SRHO_G00104620 [Serrasalmus rhombeus]
MGEAFVRELLGLCLQRIALDENINSELELFIEVMRHFETVRKKWLHAELDLKKYKELLVKSDVSRAALEVKLKHARNQVDVEIKKRYKAEADYQYLERQMLLMSDILVHDSKSGACLNDEQRSMLANFNHRGANIGQRKSKRLSVIDESSFLSHSDISYDRTDDDLVNAACGFIIRHQHAFCFCADMGRDLDSTAVVKPLKSRAREKRRSSMGPGVGVQMQKRGRLGGRSGDLLAGRQMEKETESTVVTASVTTPDNGGQIHMVIDITQETPEQPARSRADLLPSISGKSQSHPDLSARAARCSETVCVTEQTSVWAPSDVTEAEIVAEIEMSTPESRLTPDLTPIVGTLQHVFLPKTVRAPLLTDLFLSRQHLGTHQPCPNSRAASFKGPVKAEPSWVHLVDTLDTSTKFSVLNKRMMYLAPLPHRYRGWLARLPSDSVHVSPRISCFVSRALVIRPETCVPCGKRIRFGKVAVKCRDCRVMAHPECKHMCLERCSPNAHGNAHPSEETLESFTPSTRPRVPALIVECVKEIERRGLVEVMCSLFSSE